MHQGQRRYKGRVTPIIEDGGEGKMTDLSTGDDTQESAGFWARLVRAISEFWTAFNTPCDCIETTGEECEACHEMRQL